MIVTRREDIPADTNTTTVGRDGKTLAIPADDVRVASEGRDENGMTRDDIFNQLEDETHVITSGRGSRLPLTDSDGGTAPSGYSAGISSGSGAD
ncbi:MAG: hypothetical protein H8F28_26200 [Fibrella sp.]|nr:hypothetical protein [Armatimonadota bacterium]